MSGWLAEFMSGPAVYLHFGDTVIVSVGNLLVVGLMLVLFGLALVVPFPGSGDDSEGHGDR